MNKQFVTLSSHLMISLSGILFCLMSNMVYANESRHHNTQHKNTSFPSFGPGDHYLHTMSVNLSDYRHIKDISHKAGIFLRQFHGDGLKSTISN
ncbi:hypothetical protein [methane-oxidizing endosymbiont of Gigantopelta aegis]|uniref:hypothetical protein n=1 Tax=methane-oxidizing endosymbiont of Gigantopelta aegis TaxID=2794938 RepID=UPI001BE3EF05|nr:hypothetical protein [methane-oxidizing endosymbiont of Gigantopelta aegis]